jgi:hypothetical protein
MTARWSVALIRASIVVRHWAVTVIFVAAALGAVARVF